MRILSIAVCAATVLASACGAASASEITNMKPGGLLSAPATYSISGLITGAHGLKLNCAGTTAEIHDNGKKLAEVPTTPATGGCKFDAKVSSPRMSAAALTSCAGRVSFAQESERFSFATSRSYNLSSGHEVIGTLGASKVYSTLGSGATPTFEVGAEQ